MASLARSLVGRQERRAGVNGSMQHRKELSRVLCVQEQECVCCGVELAVGKSKSRGGEVR